jgi:hypothetical protein
MNTPIRSADGLHTAWILSMSEVNQELPRIAADDASYKAFFKECGPIVWKELKVNSRIVVLKSTHPDHDPYYTIYIAAPDEVHSYGYAFQFCHFRPLCCSPGMAWWDVNLEHGDEVALDLNFLYEDLKPESDRLNHLSLYCNPQRKVTMGGHRAGPAQAPRGAAPKGGGGWSSGHVKHEIRS